MTMADSTQTSGVISGLLEGRPEPLPVQVAKAARHTLFVHFPSGAPENGAEFSALKLQVDSRELSFGRSRFLSHAAAPMRRKSDPPPVGDGKLVFLDQLWDFAALPRGTVVELSKRLEQLPILWSRKENLRPAFREYVAELVFDLQVYRGLFDEIDRNLDGESPAVRSEVHRVVADSEYRNFTELFDRKLAGLAEVVRDFTQEEHERHGFYLRKHVWDIILASEFLRRTNLKPSGYAGDSTMMRMLYENAFRGPTIFSRFMHRHPVESVAAQAVRNRVGLLSQRISRAGRARPGKPVRVMSVAAGPAWELRDVFRSREDLGRYDVTLLDQDPMALADAEATIASIQAQQGAAPKVQLVRDSVRTMLRDPRLGERLGKFDVLYSMGLFDYLTAPTAKAVLKRLYDLVAPGGELIVGNFHTSNPTRMYMEYWMDWVLIYRSEEQMQELAMELPGADARIEFEDTRSQLFLCITRT